MEPALFQRFRQLVYDHAGIEHLGRGTAASVDAMLVVVEPGQRSVQTARQIQKLAADLHFDVEVVLVELFATITTDRHVSPCDRGAATDT